MGKVREWLDPRESLRKFNDLVDRYERLRVQRADEEKYPRLQAVLATVRDVDQEISRLMNELAELQAADATVPGPHDDLSPRLTSWRRRLFDFRCQALDIATLSPSPLVAIRAQRIAELDAYADSLLRKIRVLERELTEEVDEEVNET